MLKHDIKHATFWLVAIALLAIITSGNAQEIDIVWERLYRSSPDTTTFDNEITGFISMPDGGFIVSSFYQRYSIGPQAWIFRADNEGEIIWEYRWDSMSNLLSHNYIMRLNENELLFAIPVIVEGDRRQAKLTCISFDGEIHWERIHQTETDDNIFNIHLLNDSSILLHVGWYVDDDNWQNVLIRYSQEGDFINSHSWHIPMGHRKIAQLQDGRIFIPGDVQLDRYSSAPVLFVTNVEGDSLGYFQYSSNYYLGTKGCISTPEDNILLYGSHGYGDGSGNTSAFITKIDRNLEVIWSKSYPQRSHSWLQDICLLRDGRIVFAGKISIGGNGWVGEVDPCGKFVCDFADAGLGNTVFYFANATNEDEAYIAGRTFDINDGRPVRTTSLWIARIELPELSVSDTEFMPVGTSLRAPFPNPFNSTTTIGYSLPAPGNVSLTVYDLSGREVARLADGVKAAGRHEALWSAEGISSGVYVVKLLSGEKTAVSKVVLVR